MLKWIGVFAAICGFIYMSSEQVKVPASCNGKVVCVWLIK